MTQRLTGTHLAQRRRDQLFRAAEGVALLPSTLVVPMRVLVLHRRDNVEMSQYAEVIGADPSLVAKILGLVNSAAFKPAQPITKLTQALVMIGLRNLLPLVFGVSLGGIFNQFAMPAEERSALWRASLLKAVSARECVRKLRPDAVEEAFIAALMQDVALPLIHGSDRSAWSETVAIMDMADQAARVARERALYGTDHAELGAVIARRLGLPELFAGAIAHHHTAERLPASCGGNAALAQALGVAGALPHRLAPNAPGLRGRLLSIFGKFPDAADLVRGIFDSYTATLAQLGDADERSVAFKEFMQALCMEVALCMEGAIGESTTAITRLKDRGAELERKVGELKQEVIRSEYDPLTGVLNRRGFLRRAARFVELAREYDARCAVGFADIDDFKRLNDQHGHGVGDRALVALAHGLVSALRGRGIVARLGGDEFCFMLFAKDEAALAETVRHLDETFCHLEVDVGGKGGKAPITSSVGLVRLAPSGPLSDLERVMKSADELMYGAKRAGKGRCVVRDLDAA